MTPLHEVAMKFYHDCEEYDTQIAKMLITHKGADLNAKDIYGRTPLHYLAESPYKLENLYKCYLECNCDVNVQDNKGQTPLHVACEFGGDDFIYELFRYGADVNIEDFGGKTALCITNDDAPFNHVQKMIAAGLYISEKVRSICLDEIKNNEAMPPDWSKKEFLIKFEVELDKMINMKVDKYTSLYNMLFKNQQEMTKHIKNSNFIEIIESNHFEENFPQYGFLLKLQFNRGLQRNTLIEPAKESMEFMTRLSLPNLCFDYIFRYLNNEDIENLIEVKRVVSCIKRKKENEDRGDFEPLEKIPRVQ